MLTAAHCVPDGNAKGLSVVVGTVDNSNGSGERRAVAEVLVHPAYDADAIHGSRISIDAVRAVTADLLAATRERRAAMPVMHPGRVDVIGAGALVLRVLMDEFGMAEVVVSEHDILDGIALRLARS